MSGRLQQSPLVLSDSEVLSLLRFFILNTYSGFTLTSEADPERTTFLKNAATRLGCDSGNASLRPQTRRAGMNAFSRLCLSQPRSLMDRQRSPTPPLNQHQECPWTHPDLRGHLVTYASQLTEVSDCHANRTVRLIHTVPLRRVNATYPTTVYLTAGTFSQVQRSTRCLHSHSSGC